MTSTSSTIFYAVAVAAVVAAPIITSSEADAGRKGRSSASFSQTFITARPERGYEGHVADGPNALYCSYRREPIRRCGYTRSGRSSCRIVSWKLIQHCY